MGCLDRVSRGTVYDVRVFLSHSVIHLCLQGSIWRAVFASHLHLHLLSADLCSEKLTTKKHYNSFHPKLGFFLHIDEVLSWFDAEPSYFASLVRETRVSLIEGLVIRLYYCCLGEGLQIDQIWANTQREPYMLSLRHKSQKYSHFKSSSTRRMEQTWTSSARKRQTEAQTRGDQKPGACWYRETPWCKPRLSFKESQRIW